MRQFKNFLYKAGFKFICLMIYYAYCRLSVHGRKNLVAGSYILCSNHSSHMDSPALMLAAGRPFKEFYLVAAKDYFFHRSEEKSFTAKLMNLMAIDRHHPIKGLRELVRQSKPLLEKNCKLIIYPEGTRSSAQTLLPFKKGFAFAALMLDLPIVPAYVEGTLSALPKGKKYIRPRRIKVYFGQPIYPSVVLSQSAPISHAECCDLLVAMTQKSILQLQENSFTESRKSTEYQS